jgi:hypothetical protein
MIFPIITIFDQVKRILAIFLCGAVLFNTVGFIILFSATTFKWKEFIAEELDKKNPTEQLVRLIDNNTVQHINKHEVISQGKLYDVARVTRKKGITILYCYHDSREESMDAQLVNGIQQNTDNPASHSASTPKFHIKRAITDYVTEKKTQLPLSVFFFASIFQHHFPFVPEYNLSIQVPPPKG